MGEVQVVVHVEQRLPLAPDKVHRLPMRHDILRCLRVVRHRSIIKSVHLSI